ncbi:MAG: TRAP transporter substrate-binding protein [Pseudomonadales bacterium]
MLANATRTIALNVLLISVIFITACGEKSGERTIRLAHNLDIQHPVHKAMLYMNKRLKLHSADTMQLEIYSSGQLGSEREVLELLQIGTLGMTKVSASSIEAFVPAMKVFSLPYLFSSQEHLWKTLNSDIGQTLLEAGIPFRIRGLGYYDAGSRSFYSTKKQILSPDDLRGMKIRVMSSQSAVNMVNTMGGSATPVSWGELYTALQQGVVDGAENNPPSFYLSKHYEVSKYYTLDEHTSIPDVIVIGTHIWNQLNAQEQSWLQLAMNESTEHQRQLWQEATNEALIAVKAAGVEVRLADKSRFQQSVSDLITVHQGTELGDLIFEIQKLEI